MDYEKATSAIFDLQNNIPGVQKDVFVVKSQFGGIFDFLIKITDFL